MSYLAEISCFITVPIYFSVNPVIIQPVHTKPLEEAEQVSGK